jgi:hypothetical protein
VLDELTRHRHPGGAQQLLELGQLFAPVGGSSVRECGYAQGALASAAVDDSRSRGRSVPGFPRAIVTFGPLHLE